MSGCLGLLEGREYLNLCTSGWGRCGAGYANFLLEREDGEDAE